MIEPFRSGDSGLMDRGGRFLRGWLEASAFAAGMLAALVGHTSWELRTERWASWWVLAMLAG